MARKKKTKEEHQAFLKKRRDYYWANHDYIRARDNENKRKKLERERAQKEKEGEEGA